jgi:hypothetical protein
VLEFIRARRPAESKPSVFSVNTGRAQATENTADQSYLTTGRAVAMEAEAAWRVCRRLDYSRYGPVENT